MSIVLEIEEQKVVERNRKDFITLSGSLGIFYLCHIAPLQLQYVSLILWFPFVNCHWVSGVIKLFHIGKGLGMLEV